jgi:lipoprotein-anchoring transpeptidase ErfK/SrfK
MRIAMITFAAAFAGNVFAGVHAESAEGPPAAPPAATSAASTPVLTPQAINDARLETILGGPAPETTADAPDPAIARLQVLLDRSGASPGVIDGVLGDNVTKAILAAEVMRGLPPDGRLDAELIGALETGAPVIGHYTITDADVAAVGGPVPDDYAEKAQREFLGYETVTEEIAERFHMDVDLLEALNPGARFTAGERVFVTAFGPNRDGTVAYIEADKRLRQLRAYDAEGNLLVAYPATIGSEQNPSPSGVHVVDAVAPMPDYTYNPRINFQQGENTEVLTIPPGPNGPVGTMWIDLSEPTYGIHGTPDPELIDKVGSHGCVRLTNWDAQELAGMVAPGVTVEFLE